MSIIKTSILLMCLALITGCKSKNSDQNQPNLPAEIRSDLSGSFIISGAFALYPLVNTWSADFMKLHPGVKIVVASGGTGLGIDDLVAKKSQLAMISRQLTDAEQSEGIWVIPVAKEGVAPIINQKNPHFKRIVEHGVDPQKLIKLFTSESMTWGELLDTSSKEKVIVYTRADESGAASVWADFLWKQSTDLKGIKVIGDGEMVKNIQANPLSIGYCNFSYAFDSVSGDRIKDIQVMPIDLDFDRTIDRKEVPFTNINKAHRGLWLGYYPKNLTRELTFGSMGKPTDEAILEFLRYTLTDGQAAVSKCGFCELNDVYVKNALGSLK